MPIDWIRGKLERFPDAKFGFVVYRCTYGDDESWHRFMQYLTAQTRARLETEDASDLFDRVDWSVQEDPSLEGASMEEVRERFRKWLNDATETPRASPRHRACVMVEKEHVESVTQYLQEGKALDEFDMFGRTYVNLVSKYDEGSESDEEEEEDETDDEEESDEEKKAPKDRLSYTRAGISYLVPRVYTLLDSSGWQRIEGNTTP